MPVQRLPLVGSYNTRAATSNSLGSSSGLVGVGVVGVMIVGQGLSPSEKDSRFINCFTTSVVDETTQTKRVYVVKRPGFLTALTPAAGAVGSALHVWAGKGTGDAVISAFGDTNSTIYYNESSLGAITGVCTGITETTISGMPTLVLSSNDSSAWYYDTALTEITDVDYPGNAGRTMVGTFAHLDGFAFQMDSSGRIYNSDLNSVSAWTSASFLTANAVPDVGMGVVKHRNTIVGFCQRHFEVFRNAGNAAGSPLSRIEELTQNIGCISADAITTVRDTVYWIGSSVQGKMALYAYDGGRAQTVSTPEIETLMTLIGPANVSVTSVAFFGRHFVVVKGPSDTYVYCIEEKNWHEWSSTVPLWYKAAGVTTGSAMVCYAISDESDSGKVFVLSPANPVFRDNNETYSAIIQTSKLDFGTNRRKTWERIDIIGDQEAATSSLSVAWTDDDYQTTATARTVDLSDNKPSLTRCGNSRRRSFVLTHSANTPMRLEALEIEAEVGVL
jgi:hypothetical protein